MAMKGKRVVLVTSLVIMVTLMLTNVAYAGVTELKTRHVIHVRVIVPSSLSMNLEDGWVRQNLLKPEAEAFSELKDKGILVDKIRRGDSTLWLFTKTE